MSKGILAIALLNLLAMASTASAQEKKPATVLFGANIEMPIERTRTVMVRDQGSASRKVQVICVWGRIYVEVDGAFYALNPLAMQRVSSTRLLSGSETFSISGDPPIFVRAAAPSLAQVCAS